MKMFNRKAIAIAATGMILTAGGINFQPNFVYGATTSIDVAVKQSGVSNGIDWAHGSESAIIGEGHGRSNGKGMSMARLAAITDAQRQLLGTIKGVQIDAETLMVDLMIENDTVRAKVSGLLRGAQIFEEYPLENDEYCVKMYVPLYGPIGSLASVIVPEIRDNSAPNPFPAANVSALSSAEVQSIKSAHYTGVVINADGMNMDPTFSPVIYDTEGRAIYGVDNLDYDTVIAKGMVDYANDIGGAKRDGRAGNNPLIVNAVSVRGGNNSVNKVNVVVSVQDANRILLANETTQILSSTSVVFVK